MTQRIFISRLDRLEPMRLPGRLSADPLRGVAQDEMSVRSVTLPPGQPRSPHYHPHSAEFIIVLEGHGTVWWEGELHPVGPGDTVFLPRGTAHATIPAPGETMKLLCFFAHPDLGDNLVELDKRVDDVVAAARPPLAGERS